MHIEFRHLRTIKAIHDFGGLARAADHLNITQSALSHQIKGIEDQAGVELFVRRSKPLKLSAAGLRMLAAAERILPEIAALEAEFDGLVAGADGRLHIAIECHACYEWLFPVLDQFRRAWPQVDLDLRPGFAFDAMEALQREEVDLVITSDETAGDDITYTPIFDYEPVVLVARSSELADKQHIEAKDFIGQTLITYPVARERLDVFSQVLIPAKVEPSQIRQVEMTAMIFLLVAANRGISVLPDWVVRQSQKPADCVVRQLGNGAMTRRLFLATRREDVMKPFMAHVIRLARQQAVQLQR